jgi:hypothetical protein
VTRTQAHAQTCKCKSANVYMHGSASHLIASERRARERRLSERARKSINVRVFFYDELCHGMWLSNDNLAC